MNIVKKNVYKLMEELSNQQKDAFIVFKEFANSIERMFLLCGCAGSGKSFLTRVFINYIYNSGLSIIVLAPTHKALGVIRDYVDNINIECSTIAKFLCKKQTFHDNGEVSFIRESNLYMKHKYNYIFIDEASMIDMDDFHCFQNIHSSKIIFIGDLYQLPPIGEVNSIVFDKVCYKYELTETIRTSHNTLQTIYNEFRNFIIKNIELELDDNEHFTVYNSKSDFFTAIQENYSSNCKIITYRNIMVDVYNKYIRKICLKTNEPYIIGEQLVFTQPYLVDYQNNTEVIVKNATKCKLSHPFTHVLYTVYKLDLMDDNSIYKIADESRDEHDFYFKKMLHEILTSTAKNKTKKWAKYYTWKNAFDAPVVYNYAMTAYKSQGSTIPITFIDLDDIFHSMINKDTVVMKKAMYTSITRASDKIYLLL